MSVALTGLVGYRRGDGNLLQFTWVDRSGTARGTVGPRDATLNNPSLSPDGRRVAVSRTAQGNTDIWLLDGLREGRGTVDPQSDRYPIWSADGTRITFSRAAATFDLHQQRGNGAGEAARVVASDQIKVATSWSPDGRFLLFNSLDPQTGVNIWVVEPGRETPGDRPHAVWLKTPFREGYAMFSPDGRWVAYQSNDSGRPEIYVRPFVPPSERASVDQATERWQISVGGGIHPVWLHDGKELFFLSPAGEMMAASLATTGAAVVPGVPVALFPARVAGGGIDAQQARQYDVAPDGRFLINTVVESGAGPITLLQNWAPEAKQ